LFFEYIEKQSQKYRMSSQRFSAMLIDAAKKYFCEIRLNTRRDQSNSGFAKGTDFELGKMLVGPVCFYYPVKGV